MIDINFPDEICLRTARTVADHLAGLVVRGATVTLEGARFVAADVAGIQLLLAAHRTASEQDASFAVTLSSGGALHDALIGLGLADPTGRPTIASHPFIAVGAAE